MERLNSLKAIAAAVIATASIIGGQADATTLSAADVSSSFNVIYECRAGDPCPDAGNSPSVDLSALAVFTLDSFTDNGTDTFATFSVSLSNTSTDGTSRITAIGFATDPDATIGGITDGNADGVNWDGGSGFIPGFNGLVELCAFATNSCSSASGGASNGVQAGASDSFGLGLTFTGVIASFVIDTHAVKFASVANSGDGSYEFGGTTTVVPLPAAGWLLLGGIGGLAALRRRRKS